MASTAGQYPYSHALFQLLGKLSLPDIWPALRAIYPAAIRRYMRYMAHRVAGSETAVYGQPFRYRVYGQQCLVWSRYVAPSAMYGPSARWRYGARHAVEMLAV